MTSLRRPLERSLVSLSQGIPRVNLDEYPDLLAWVPPVITNEQKYFGYDLFHVNETGRAVWTAQLIHELKRIIK